MVTAARTDGLVHRLAIQHRRIGHLTERSRRSEGRRDRLRSARLTRYEPAGLLGTPDRVQVAATPRHGRLDNGAG